MKVTILTPASIAGNLIEEMKKIGYIERWQPNTWREIPEPLVRRLAADGLALSPALSDMEESERIYIALPEKEQSNKELLALWTLKYSHEKRLEVLFTKGVPIDGNLKIRWLAAGYKGQQVYKNQILSLPESFVKTIVADGVEISFDIPEDFRAEQAKFREEELRIREGWEDDPPKPTSIEAMKEELKSMENVLKALLKEPVKHAVEVELVQTKYNDLADKIKAAEQQKAEEDSWPANFVRLGQIDKTILEQGEK